MLKNEERHIASTCLIVILFAVSFLKDDFSPDYLNTPNAAFLETAPSRFQTLFEFPSFWLCAIAYSAVFIVLPYRIFLFSSNKQFATLILLTLSAVAVLLYLMVFSNIPKLDTVVIPKINRFFHSPIITLFLLAAFTLNTRFKDA
jgi:hypothetical protein